MNIIHKDIEPETMQEGAFYDEDYFTTRITTNTDFYVNGKLLCCLRRNVFDNDRWFPIVDTHLRKPLLTSNNRRVAGDDPRKRVNSGIIGFFDRLTPQMKHRTGLSKAGRPTAFVRKYPREWGLLQPLFRALDRWYRKSSPRSYHIQKKAIGEVAPALRINNTVFTTVTVNRDWRTAAHTDKGDFKEALSCIAFLGRGFRGGYFGFPRYRILIEARPGDAILADPHEPHCNTRIEKTEANGTRYSMVCYLREDLRGMTRAVRIDNDLFFIHPSFMP